MLYYLLFWTLLGFIIHFYIIFGTNLLTGGPTHNWCFLPILGFRRKGISNGVQTEWNLRERDFLNKQDPRNLDPTSRHKRGGHEVGGRPPPSWPPLALLGVARVQISWITFCEKIMIPKVSFRLDSVWYSVSSKHWNRQKTTILGASG